MTLVNPFTPSEIASEPDDFFGRAEELRILEASLPKGSVTIQGAIGIGKSSLMARGRLLMEGFDSEHRSTCTIAVGDKDVKTVDDAARLLLESFLEVDEKQEKIRFKIGSFFETESAQISRYFSEGRHLAVLKRIVEKEFLDTYLDNKNLLILAVDEADKCPIPLARLIRAISTHTQHQGVKRVRFLFAGVSPFFQQMVAEDSGINRFVYRTIMLEPMTPEEASDLVETKLTAVAIQAEKDGFDVRIDPHIVPRVVALSGGHPHLLQLLGSHLIEHENSDPDGVIDSNDLMNSLRRICYENRAKVYDSAIHELELAGIMEQFAILLEHATAGFPTRIHRDFASGNISNEALKWLVDHNILSVASPIYYGLVDEFLRIRLLLDSLDSESEADAFEKGILCDLQTRRKGWSAVVAVAHSVDAFIDEGETESEDGEGEDDEPTDHP